MSCQFVTPALRAIRTIYSNFRNRATKYVLRREPKASGAVHLGKSPLVSRGPFKPRPVDVDGISVYLNKEVDPATVAADGKHGAAAYYVLRVKLSVISGQGLTVIPKPDTRGIPGHSVIPEIHPAQDENKIKEWAAKLSLSIEEKDVWDGALGKWLGE